MADTNIKTQISRLSGAKSDLATAITAKGVTVPDTTTLDRYAALVEQIAAAATGLSTQAQELVQAVAVFQVDAAGATPLPAAAPP